MLIVSSILNPKVNGLNTLLRPFKLVLLSLFIILSACSVQGQVLKDSLSRKGLITALDKLYTNDQKYRQMLVVFKRKFMKADSTTMLPLFSNDTVTRLTFKLFREDIIKPQDELNTKKLLKIINTYGFPGMEYMHHDIPVFLVFVHAPKAYFNEIKSLIDKEYKAGHASKFEHDYITWHINGRKGIPPYIPHAINYRRQTYILKSALNYLND